MAKTRARSPFESLRKQAKAWLKVLCEGDPGAASEALARLEQVLPRHADPPVLREVQQALAREQGFATWAALKEHHAIAGSAGFQTADASTLVDAFLEHACIFTEVQDLPVKWRRAERILSRHPEIAQHSIHTAVACGEVDRVAALLAQDPLELTLRGGPQQWTPLLFACYGRIEQARERALEMIQLLLDAGADPNTHFVTADDWRLRFNALTGVMGQGEMGQPEHPDAEVAARLLLDRGAEPNDGQGLYNTRLVGDETRWLTLLISYGLDTDSPVSWHADPADAAASGADKVESIFDYLVVAATGNGHVQRLKLLLEHGADPNAFSIYDGKTCYEHARMSGSREATALLLRHGATASPLVGHDAFVAAVCEGERATAEELVRAHPEFRRDPHPLIDAASRVDLETVRLLLELGVDPNVAGRHGHRALNSASEDRQLAELLLAHGADPRARAFGGSACGWARHAGNLEMARFFAEQSGSLLDTAMSGHAPLARKLLADDPDCIEERSPDGNGPLHELCLDVELAEPLIAMFLALRADPDLENDAGETPARRLEALGADEVADLLEVMRGG
jgi:ankyrin repeat protein